jgi:hypothetical protein
VGLELQAGASGGAFDHPGEASRGKRRSPLAEDEGRRRALPLEPAQIGQSKTTGGTTIFRFPAHPEQTIVLGSPSQIAVAVGRRGMVVEGMLSDS